MKKSVSEFVFGVQVLKERQWLSLLPPECKRFAIITDAHVEKLYGGPLQRNLEKGGFHADLFSFPAGEEYKNRQTKERLEDALFEKGHGRQSVVIGLGGGVVTDMAGFVAATFCRGIPYVCIPTTLMGMCDAGYGGKVAVNTPFGKNLVGAFYPPTLLVVDPTFLKTLPAQEVLNGKAEMLKHALIRSPRLFTKLEKSPQDVLGLIEENLKIKRSIVLKDPYEGGLRRILNFGHTVGHALEAACEYQLTHGEAIAIGMHKEAYLSFLAGYLKKEDFKRIERVLLASGFSLSLPTPARVVHSFLKRDKKALALMPRFVLLEAIGKAKAFEGVYCTTVEENLISEALHA